MASKPRVHEIASSLGVDSKVPMAALKEMGEHVKGPSSSIELAVARRLVQRLRGGKGVVRQSPTMMHPASEHPEAIHAAARRSAVMRDDSDWAKYGFTLEEKRIWTRAGIPDSKAHWAAMCRDAQQFGGSQITPQDLED
jgi:hypothetical protein